MGKVGARIASYCWRVVAVDATGRGMGTCGHRHATPATATVCPWTPTPWPERCDLLVREVRDDAAEPAPVEQMEMGL